jgi:pimeloyl-ACP methyl ester carboxylesterase
MTQTAKEQALLLGPRRSLVGILTEGEPSAPAGAAVVILNSGILHRVGANRMSVPLARALARAGHPVLRFDLSGLGDSDPRPDALSPLDATLADIGEALDTFAAARGIRRVILAGLCSGADHAVVYAARDPRVVGAVLLDPTVPATRRHRLNHYRGRLFRAESWLNVLRGTNPLWRELKRRLRRAEEARPSLEPSAAEVRAYLAGAYSAALERDVRFLAVTTGERCSYREQLLDAFADVPFGERLRLEHFAGSDHTFAAEAARARLYRLVVEWAATVRCDGASAARRPGGGAAAGGSR